MKQTDQQLDARIDAALARLAVWNPPEDFARRIAAAAARQAALRGTRARASAAGELLGLLNQSVLAAVGCAAVAAVVAWAVPWGSIAANSQILVWLSTVVCAAAGLWLTLRTLRRI